MADDVGLTPSQWSSCRGILLTLKYAPQFQPDIGQWAQELDAAWAKPDGKVINILRDWYRENEEKLRDGAFLEVRPGRIPRSAIAAASLPSHKQEPGRAVSDSKPMAITAVPYREAKSYVIEIAAAGAFTLLAGLLFFWKRPS